MNLLLAMLFWDPMQLPSKSLLWMLLPLCLVVAIVYKTVRTRNIRRLWWETLYLFGYIVGGLVVLGVAAWLLVARWP